MNRYPRASWHGGATTYGPLPDHGKQLLSLVLHTTETRGVPSFGNGDTAPHLVYDPRDRSWSQWADFDRYVGTMKGHSTGGHGNCQAIQVEIIAYSDRNAAGSQGLWVGDFTQEHYQDLAHLYRWLVDQGLTHWDLTPTPAGGWKYGTSSPHRMNSTQWDAFCGLTCHGAVPLNTHWDTGVLDLERIWDMAFSDDGQCPWDPQCDRHYQNPAWAKPNTGVCNVPAQQEPAIDWCVAQGIIQVRDDFRDDYRRELTDGRYWVMEYRQRGRTE